MLIARRSPIQPNAGTMAAKLFFLDAPRLRTKARATGRKSIKTQTGGDFKYLTADGEFDFANGWLKKSTHPGLGITVDEEKVRRAAETGHNWQNARWRLSDGTPIDW